jgi:cytochrome P450
MRTATLLLGAGFETTASLLTAVMYLLCTHRHCLEKVTREVRSSFESAEDITFVSVNKLPYMIACLSEALRWYPPIANGLQRVAMKGGTTVAGVFVPEQVSSKAWGNSAVVLSS